MFDSSQYHCNYIAISRNTTQEKHRKQDYQNLVNNNHYLPHFQTKIRNYVKQMINYRWHYSKELVKDGLTDSEKSMFEPMACNGVMNPQQK